MRGIAGVVELVLVAHLNDLARKWIAAEDPDHRIAVVGETHTPSNGLCREGRVVVTDANVELHAPLFAKITGSEPRMLVFAARDGAPIERTIIRTKKATRKAWFKNGRLDPDSSLVELVKTAFHWAKEDADAKVLGIISVHLVETMLRFVAGLAVDRCIEDWKTLGQPRSSLDAFSKALAPTLASWPGTILTAHYGATRGLDDMAQADALITLGDPWGNLNAAKNASVYLSREYEWERRYEDCCRAELEQAHGRLRTIHRTRPGRALHVGAVMPGGVKWSGERVNIRDLVLEAAKPPTPEPTVSAEQFASMVKRLGGARAVARLLGCGHVTISNYVSGTRVAPAELAMRLADALESSTQTDEPSSSVLAE